MTVAFKPNIGCSVEYQQSTFFAQGESSNNTCFRSRRVKQQHMSVHKSHFLHGVYRVGLSLVHDFG